MNSSNGLRIAALALMLLTVAADAVWFFAFALPQHPPIAAVAPPSRGAGDRTWEAYDARVDRARIELSARDGIIATAIAIPLTVASCIGLLLLFQDTRTAER